MTTLPLPLQVEPTKLVVGRCQGAEEQGTWEMLVSNTLTGTYLHFTQQEIEHVGGLGVRIDVEMSSYNWQILPRISGRYRLIAQKNNRGHPGRLIMPQRSDLNHWGATSWSTALKEGRIVTLTVGSMDTPLVDRRPTEPLIPRREKEILTPMVIQHDMPSFSLRDAIEEVNRHRDRLGDQLVLSIDRAGFLRAMVEYGRSDVLAG